MRFRFLLILLFLTGMTSLSHGTVDARLDNLHLSITASTEDEATSIAALSSEAEQEKQRDIAIQSEGRAYRILAASQRNLLLSPQTSIAELEKAQVDQQTSLHGLENQLQRIDRQWERLESLRLQTDNRKRITEEQLSSILAEESDNPEATRVHGAMETLLQKLLEKTRLLETMQTTLEKRRQEFLEIRQDMEALSLDFQQKLKERKTMELFQKNQGLKAFMDRDTPIAIFNHIRSSALRILSPDFWEAEIRPLFQLPPPTLIRILILGLFLLPLTLRIRFFLKKMESLHPEGWLGILLEISRKSLVFMVLALFTESVVRSQAGLSATGLFKMVTSLTWFVTLYRLLIAFPAACKRDNRPRISEAHLSFLQRLTGGYLVFVPLFICSAWIFPPDSPLFLMERVCMEAFVLLLVFRFWKHKTSSAGDLPLVRMVLEFSGKGIALGAPVLEFLGYGSLALFWYWAWGITLICGGLYLLFFTAMREWAQKIAVLSSQTPEEETGQSAALMRLGLKMLPIVLLPLPIFVIARAWGLQEALFPGFMQVLRYPLTFGGMELSLLRFFQALCVLLITLAATRFFRAFIEKRILMESGVEQGLRASILTLVGYILWGIGILSALHVFGLNTTSLTVAFGALGVGLGFGLQAIFNNFVSGIILLFERPIQVGDVIEIDGIWGTVTRINVRSTVVQTYDNASLIIPNADFISNRLTNWSFKDQRLRKNVDVGVGYSSDVKHVEKILMEIACNTRGVLIYPPPDVHFMDFGDSALIFRLRFWSTLPEFRIVETQIRFAITHEFRKAGIEIPFPQRDLHLRSGFPVKEEETVFQESQKTESPEASARKGEAPPHMAP